MAIFDTGLIVPIIQINIVRSLKEFSLCGSAFGNCFG